MVFHTVRPISKKTIFITGCDSGIGNYLALKLLSDGHRVIGTFINRNSFETIEFLKYPEAFIPVLCDFTESIYIAEINKVLIERGVFEIDCLINNAGVSCPGKVDSVTAENILEMFNINIVSMILVTKTILSFLKKKSGRIINVSSFNGVIGFSNLSVYSATKYAVEGFTDSLRRELKDHNIKVILIRPGYFKTKIWDAFMQSEGAMTSAKDDSFLSFVKMLSTISSDVDGVQSSFYKAIFNKAPADEINIFRKYQYLLLFLNSISKVSFDIVADFFINYSKKLNGVSR